MSRLVITILEEATAFEGADTVYRYDLVPPVLAEPWALTAAVEQAQAVVEGDGSQAEVRVEVELPPEAPGYSAAMTAVAAIRDALREAGLGQQGQETTDNDDGCAEQTGVYPARIVGHDEESLRGMTSPARPAHRGNWGTGQWWRRFTWIHVAMVGIVVAVLGLSWWAMGETSSVGVAPKAQQIVGSAVPRDKEETASATAEPTPVPPSLVVHEIGRIRVSTPVGFRGEIEGEDVVFRGEDEGLRIRIAADPVLGVPAEVVMDEVRETVERDPTLSEANSPGLPQGDNPHEEKVTYREEPGDGSVVQWSTWVEAGHHMSVGCHTREASTVVQRAACRVAEESVGLL